jgi:hypothetical protein
MRGHLVQIPAARFLSSLSTCLLHIRIAASVNLLLSWNYVDTRVVVGDAPHQLLVLEPLPVRPSLQVAL